MSCSSGGFNQPECTFAVFWSTWRHLQKKACKPQNGSDRTSPAHGDAGSESRACLTPLGWCLSTKLRSAPTWRGSGARAPRGVRVIGHVPLGEWKTITFASGLRHNRMTAPMVVDGPMTGEMFLAYVKQCLVPTLRRNDIVVMDNFRAHKVPGIREAIEKARATVRYLPKYSPDLNPIEMPYSKFKALLRKAAERTVRGPLPNNSIVRATAQCSRMRELFQACRICCKMTGNRF